MELVLIENIITIPNFSLETKNSECYIIRLLNPMTFFTQILQN